MNSTLKFLNFSPNSSKMNGVPLAESTAIGSPLTKQYQGNQKRKSISPISNQNANSKQKTNLKIDPHVLTDAQSNGIVTRLVKYYDQSNEPERSRTVYNKFGDYPLVHLKKTELKRPISRSTAVRIAPPNRTVMNPNLRAAIMRSSSFQMNSGIPKIIPTKMRAKDDSHKIITNHEPITDPNYPVSSKSVLDALEKNCRKRINNEELTLDRSKKLCAPVISEIVDSPSPREFIPISSNQQTAKRNREDLSPSKISQSSLNADVTSNQAKKVKTRNNALLSSLSSSHFELLPSISSAIQNNSKIVSVSTKIVPKPKEIQIIKEKENSKDKVVAINVEEFKPKEIEQQPQKKLQLFNAKPDPNAAINKAKLKSFERNVSEEDEDDDDEIKIRFVKPKEKVLENYDVINYVEKDKLNKMLKGLSQGIKSPVKESTNIGKDTVDSQNKPVTSEKQIVASISFTTSTTSSTIAPISTPSISSAAISVNPPIVSSTVTSEKKENEIPTSNVLTSSSGIQTTTNSTIKSDNNWPKPAASFQFGAIPSITTQSDVPKSTSCIVSSTSSEPVSAMIIPSKPISPLAVFSTPKIDQTSDPNKSLSLISFTPAKPVENATTAQQTPGISTVVTTSSSLPMFGSGTTGGFKFGESTVSKDENKPSGGFSFGSKTTSDKVEPKMSTGFSFGSNNSTQSPTVLTNTPSFSFGSNNIPKLPTSSPLLAGNNPSQTPSLSFQNPVSTTTASNTTNMFSFGANSAQSNFPSPQTTASSTFGSNIGIVSPMSNNPSSFAKPETTVASGVGFSFGSSNKSANSAFSFGGSSSQMPSTAPATTSSGFSFGSPLTTTIQSTGMFSAPATTAAPNFSFGSSVTNTATANSSSGFTGFGSTAPQKIDSSGPFAFGQKPQTAPVTTTSSAFSFGNPLQNTSSAISAQPSIGSAFNFGQSTTPTNNENKPSGIFARLGEKQPEVKPFSFGGANTNNNPQQNSSIPAFGSGNSILSSASNAPNLFGSNQSNATSVFGQSPTLGNNTGNLFSSSNNNNQATTSPFGSNTSQSQSGNNLFSFGTSTNNNNNNGNNSSQPSGGIFGFGASNNNNSNNTNVVSPSSNNIFGSTNNNNSGQNVSASFTFNTATGNVTSSQPQNSSPFGQNSAPPPYQFGSSNTGNNASASFNFSSAPSSAPTPQTNSQPFNFGQSNNTPVPGNFNFQGQTTAVPQPSPAGLFNIGTGGNQQQRRPTRVATRRYK